MSTSLRRNTKDEVDHAPIDVGSVVVVVAILIGAVVANLAMDFPAAGVWLVLLLAAPVRRPAWRTVPPALRGSAFLLSLVLAASMMPVERLPSPTWPSTLLLGVVSAFFDNIPLTKLALDQGGYDWGVLAYAVGCGGSMMWFGSSAGVAVSTLFPEARSAGAWIREGWYVPVGFVVGFFALILTVGWKPT